VKRISNNQTIDETLFRREVNSLMKVDHQNIVRFLGFCSNTEHKLIEIKGSGEYVYAEVRERLLCFEYIENGSLDEYITGTAMRNVILQLFSLFSLLLFNHGQLIEVWHAQINY
jgi:serine/threonine protein kinase